MTPAHRIGTHEEWQTKRDELLKQEQEFAPLPKLLAYRQRTGWGACLRRGLIQWVDATALPAVLRSIGPGRP